MGLHGRASDDKINEIMSQVELDPQTFLERYPAELSGGQKQRVGIARALAAHPKLIICDEIISSLDQLVAEEVLKLLVNLQASTHLSYLFITHDIASVRSIADDVVVMQFGRVIEKGTKGDVLESPKEPYTRRLLAAVPELDPTWLSRVLNETAEESATYAE
jgi:peptide/nickel transport system ATP-binding protein